VESGWAIGKCSPSVLLDRHVTQASSLKGKKNASRMLALHEDEFLESPKKKEPGRENKRGLVCHHFF
jgi:hypothetical protein